MLLTARVSVVGVICTRDVEAFIDDEDDEEDDQGDGGRSTTGKESNKGEGSKGESGGVHNIASSSTERI